MNVRRQVGVYHSRVTGPTQYLAKSGRAAQLYHLIRDSRHRQPNAEGCSIHVNDLVQRYAPSHCEATSLSLMRVDRIMFRLDYSYVNEVSSFQCIESAINLERYEGVVPRWGAHK